MLSDERITCRALMIAAHTWEREIAENEDGFGEFWNQERAKWAKRAKEIASALDAKIAQEAAGPRGMGKRGQRGRSVEVQR